MRRHARSLAALVAISFALTSLVQPAQAAAAKTATGVACTIVGTAGNDVLNGTSKADVICGLAGNDKINGLGGNDVLDGGIGNDQLTGGVGRDAFDGGNGLNSCDISDTVIEARHYSCSLMPQKPNFKRVSGKINSPNFKFDGCILSLHSYANGGATVANGVIYQNGRFDFDAPAGDYTYLIGEPDGNLNERARCKVAGALRILASHQIVNGSTPFVTISVPKAVSTRVYVKNKQGQVLAGAKVSVQSVFDWSVDCLIATDPKALCANLSQFTLKKAVTGKAGFVQMLLPVGIKLKASANASTAAGTKKSPVASFTVGSAGSLVLTVG